MWLACLPRLDLRRELETSELALHTFKQEHNILSVSTFTVAGSTVNTGIGDIKTVNRDANGNISLTLNAAEIYRKTGNLRAVQLLLGHTKVDSTVRYLGVELEDALSIAERIDI